MLASERLNSKEIREENERKIREKLSEVRMTVEEEESVSEVFRLFKDTMTTAAAEVVWYRDMRSQRKGNTWRTYEI